MKLGGLLSGRCPRCASGPIFPSTFLGFIGVMHESCPVCGLVFLREAGYFLGAMYISYGLGIATILPVSVLLAVVLRWDLALVLTIMVLQTLISMPLFFRYSRIIWLYFDQAIDPR